MKIKTMICIFIFLSVFIGITGIYASTIPVGNSSFTIPDGFEVYSSKGDQVALLNNNTAIRVYSNNSHDDEELLKEYRLKLGYTLTGEDNYDFEGISINQQNYTKDNTTTSVYMFTKNDEFFMIAVSVLNGHSFLEDYEDTVREIIHSLN